MQNPNDNAAPKPSADAPAPKKRERTRPRPTDKASRKKWKDERAIALGDKPSPPKHSQ